MLKPGVAPRVTDLRAQASAQRAAARTALDARIRAELSATPRASVTQIAAAHGVTTWRVYQLRRDLGLPPVEQPRVRLPGAAHERVQRAQLAAAIAGERRPFEAARHVARALGCAPSTAETLIGDGRFYGDPTAARHTERYARARTALALLDHGLSRAKVAERLGLRAVRDGVALAVRREQDHGEG